MVFNQKSTFINGGGGGGGGGRDFIFSESWEGDLRFLAITLGATNFSQYFTTFPGNIQRRIFRNISQWAWNLLGLRELACHPITAFPGKLKGVLHSQEDGTNIFPSQLYTMSELCAFHHEHP